MLEQVNNTLGRIEILGDTSSWDFGFMESLRDQLQSGRTISEKQEVYYQQIMGRYSDEAITARADFAKSWDDDKELQFTVALRYYKITGYYNSIVYKYLDQDDGRTGIPVEKEYNKLVNNKYAQGVIRNLRDPTKYPVGTAATFNSKAIYSRQGKAVVILKNCDEISQINSHAKGAKPIQVLPIGSSTPIWTEERYLKRVKKTKKR
jgi:hypothetical protein